jgi:hypothetical protein
MGFIGKMAFLQFLGVVLAWNWDARSCVFIQEKSGSPHGGGTASFRY